MSQHDETKPSFDEILASIRADEPSRDEIDGAAERVSARLGLDVVAPAPAGAAHIESCAGFQALIPNYLAARLPRETALLLEDHSRECIPCRRALIAARQPKVVTAAAGSVSPRPAYRRWMAAAALAAVGVLGSYVAWRMVPAMGADPRLKVMQVEGSLYQLREGALVELRPGMSVSAKDIVRTAKSSGALVMMDDGSRIEMRERTDLAVEKRRDGATIQLGGGAIIVEASPQGSGHLDVRTDDCLVAVKGTIFAVNHGTRGSRVSVVEGAVKVAADGRENLLHPGDQMTTSDALANVDVRDEFAWSQDADRYVQLLHELAALRKDLDARVPSPAMRYGSRLLDRMPDGTVLYAAIPNVTESLVEAKKVFEEHVAQSDALQAWWNEHMNTPEHRQDMDEAFERVKAYGSQLGDEIVVSLSMDAAGHVRGPIVSAEVKDPSALRKMVVKDLRKTENGKEIAQEASLSFDGKLVRLEPAKNARAKVESIAWSSSPLKAKIEAAYADGASWLFAADLKTMLSRAVQDAPGQRAARQLERSGILDAEYLVFERTEGPDGAEHRAEISFDQPRRGIVGWLAAPAPLGAADFISPDASFAVAAVMKRPEVLFADALEWIGVDEEWTNEHIAYGADGLAPLQDLAATLGGDVAIALDGPVLPVPSWKIAVEVYDPVRFQQAFEQLLALANEHIAASGQEGHIVIERENTGNRTDWVVRSTGPEAGHVPMRYTFVDGYLVAAPSQILLDRAIEQRRNGYTLTRSSGFQALLPRDGQVNVSAVVWQHLGPVIGPLAGRFAGIVDSEEAREIEAMAADSHPRLITAYAEDDRIVIGSRGGESGFGSVLGAIVSGQELATLGRVLERVHQAEPNGAPSTP